MNMMKTQSSGIWCRADWKTVAKDSEKLISYIFSVYADQEELTWTAQP